MATLFVDADACPVKAEALRVGLRHKARVVMVSNGGLRPSAYPGAEMVVVEAGPDVADIWIAERAGPGDVVVTSDVPLAARADVLAFQTAPLLQDVELTGPVTVQLWVATDGPDTDFTAKLVDVHPGGQAIHIAEGIIRARHRGGLGRAELLEPGEAAEYRIALAATLIAGAVALVTYAQALSLPAHFA